MKKILLIIIAAFCLSACFSPWQNDNEAVITISLGQSNSSRSALPWPPQENDWILEHLDYEIVLTSSTETIDITANGADTSIIINVPAGNYHIKVDAYFTGTTTSMNPNGTGTITLNPDGEKLHYATGENTADVRPGRNNAVTVPMHPASDIDLPIGNQPVNAMPPEITEHPESGTYGRNDNITLSVKAVSQNGGTLSYQWYSINSSGIGTNPNTGGTVINGATNANFSPSSETEGTFYYYVTVTNTITDNEDGGTKTASVSSNVATITINDEAVNKEPGAAVGGAPELVNFTHNSITINRISDLNPATDQDVEYARNTTNAVPSGGWQINTIFEGLNPGVTYYIFARSQGNETYNAGPASPALTVTTLSLIVVTTQPASITVLEENITQTLTAAATITPAGPTLTYQWFVSNSNGIKGDDPVSTGATFTIPQNLTVNESPYYYIVEVSAQGIPSVPVLSSLAVVTVTTPQQMSLTVTGAVELSPVSPTATITVNTGGVNANVTIATQTGITFNGTDTLTYSVPTTTFTNPNVTLTFNATADGYYDAAPQTLTIKVFDGQEDTAVGNNDRRIPVNQANINAFNTYARANPGLTRHYRQTEPIALSGTTNNWTAINNFTGSYDGRGHNINNLIIDISSPNNPQGMFGLINNAVIRNVRLNNSRVTAGSFSVGGIVGEAQGTSRIENSSFIGNVVGNGNIPVGGIAGVIVISGTGIVSNCYTEGIVQTGGWGGGIVGQLISGTVQYCYSISAVTTSSGYDIGGIAGENTGTIQNCVALNTYISGGENRNRIVGRNTDGTTNGTLRNNYGRTDMSGAPTTNGAATVNGANIALTEDPQSPTNAWWETLGNWFNAAWNMNTIWYMNEDGINVDGGWEFYILPVLRMPQ